MFEVLQPLVVWPDKGAIIAHMPSCFKPRYAKAVCIVDCSEVFIKRPTCLTARAQTYSNYKSHNTVKFLVAITPTGDLYFKMLGRPCIRQTRYNKQWLPEVIKLWRLGISR